MRAWLPAVPYFILIFAVGAFAASPDGRPAAATAPFPTYTDRSQNPEVWDGIADALRKAGQLNAIAAIRVRESAVWSAHVDLKAGKEDAPHRALVSYDLNAWKVLCVTSQADDCSKYGR